MDHMPAPELGIWPTADGGRRYIAYSKNTTRRPSIRWRRVASFTRASTYA
jgi:hypothetical protein